MPQLKTFLRSSIATLPGLALAAALLMTGNNAGQAFAADSTTVSKSKTAAAAKTPVKKTGQKEKKSETAITVYYFHGYARCASCRKIEQYTKEAAESLSSGAYAGRVTFAALNVEEKGNEHFIKDYQLTSKSVILQPAKDGKPGAWENLDRIWLELGSRDKFIAYVKDHITAKLEAK